MKLVKLTLVVAMFLSAGLAKAEDGGVGPRTSLDEYRAGEFKCPRLVAELKKLEASKATAEASGVAADSAN